jgi:ribonuclease HI
MTLPLRAREYISHDPKDANFGAIPYTKTAWPDASLALPAYKAEHLTMALEQALYSAHAHRRTQPSSHILILPNWQHSPYLARNLHSAYVQKLTSIPYLSNHTAKRLKNHTKLNIYLVANERALSLLDKDYITHTLHETLTNILGRDTRPITLTLNLKDPAQLDSSQAYKDPYPCIPMKTTPNRPPQIRPYRAAWDPKAYVYTDGSLVTGNPTLGASIVNPNTQTTTHIEIKSQPERHTINRAELAAITLALKANQHEPTLAILTDSAFSINTIRKYAIDPLSFNHHPHKELLQLADDIIRTRDNMGYNTHIGKVKSHTGVTHNDEADSAARGVVEGQKTPDIIFTDADPSIRGLRTWPLIRGTKRDINPRTHNLADLHSGLHNLIRKYAPNNSTATTPYTGKSYTTPEPQDQTTRSMHIRRHPTGRDGTPWR